MAPVVDFATPEQKAQLAAKKAEVKQVAHEVDEVERQLFPRTDPKQPLTETPAAKALYFLHGHRPGRMAAGFPLRAILLPRVTGLTYIPSQGVRCDGMASRPCPGHTCPPCGGRSWRGLVDVRSATPGRTG